eukprot:9641532-Prorocentrum_lima.AAC.1
MAIVHAELHGDKAPEHCLPHTTYQEVYFADDTICFSGDARSLELLAQNRRKECTVWHGSKSHEV